MVSTAACLAGSSPYRPPDFRIDVVHVQRRERRSFGGNAGGEIAAVEEDGDVPLGELRVRAGAEQVIGKIEQGVA